MSASRKGDLLLGEHLNLVTHHVDAPESVYSRENISGTADPSDDEKRTSPSTA